MAFTYDPTTEDAGTVQKVDAGTVIIDLNVRKDIRLDKSFVSSVRVRGFEQLPVGYLDEDGKAHITIGQRRVSAALEIGWPVIPMVIRSRAAAEAARAEEQRILAQLAENEQRASLTDSEIAAGYKELALIGVSEDQIARKTNKPRAHVATALAVSNSDVATGALAALPITLDQAAFLVEFEDDSEAVDRLLQVAADRPSSLVHEAQRIRDARAIEAARAAAAEELAAQGWEILESRPSHDDRSIRLITNLWRADDEKHEEISPTEALKYSGAAAYVGQSGYYDREQGRLTSVSHYIRGWADQQLDTYPDHSVQKGPATDAEKAAKKAERQQNADLRSATTVRREWLKSTLLADRAKIHIPSAVDLIAASILAVDTAASDGKIYPIAAELLGIADDTPAKGSYGNKGRTAVIDAYRAGADPLRIALAVAIARTESVLGDPTGWPSAKTSKTTVGYYVQLEDWGYTLSDAETAIAHPKRGGKK